MVRPAGCLTRMAAFPGERRTPSRLPMAFVRSDLQLVICGVACSAAKLEEAMLDSRMFDLVRKPLADAETLPPRCYHDHSFYDLEKANIFLRKWILIGRSDEWNK